MSDPNSLQYPSLVNESLTSISSGVVVHKNTSHVSLTQDVAKSSFVHNTLDGTSTEICRDEVEMNMEGSSATVSLGVLHEFADGVKTIQPVISTSPDATTISSVESESVFNLTLDGSISWNSDDASLYLSSNKVFRFRYIKSDGISSSRLALEALDEESGVYLPKVEFLSD